MFNILLTQDNTFIIGAVGRLLGFILNGIFEFLNLFGIQNIGLCIILFTFIVKLLMLPLTIKQQKFSKLSSKMQPELQAIQKKYQGKKDEASVMAMNEETKAVYAKYGTSPTGGCLQLLIQMPILFALYRVAYNIPAYVSSVKEIYNGVATQIMASPGYTDVINKIAEAKNMVGDKYDYTVNDKVIDLLYRFTQSDWDTLTSSLTNLPSNISESITHMNTFLGGINIAEAPGIPFVGGNPLTVAVLIPILAGLTSWLSTKTMNTNSNQMEGTAASTMKTMNIMMPLMSVFFTVSLPASMGIYWIATSVFQIIQQLAVNKYMDKVDVEVLIQKNIDKENKKRAKKGLPPKKVTTVANANVRNIEKKKGNYKSEEERAKEIKDSTEYYNKGNLKPGSLAAKANMVQQYNEKHKK